MTTKSWMMYVVQCADGSLYTGITTYIQRMILEHNFGMKGAKFILAINKDPEAPIFEIADYAVVGDVLEIIPSIDYSIFPQLYAEQYCHIYL